MNHRTVRLGPTLIIILFTVALLALNDAELAQKLSAFRLSQTEKVLAKTLE